MPHCIIEYSNDIEINPQDLINAVFNGALASKLFEEEHIKTRSIPYEHYQKGKLKEQFIHVAAHIHSGRTLEQRASLSKLILDELLTLGLTSVTLTVEVVEMEKASYAKRVI